MSKTEKSCVVSDSTITNKFGDRPPCTYSIKIQSLSQLKSALSSNEGYKSRIFSSGNYNWRLVVYPKGNEKDNGRRFVSMYVELDSTSLAASTVLAYFTFFVYNKKENKYFTIQDVEGKQFSALRPMWGCPQMIPLYIFNNPENGYIFEGDQFSSFVENPSHHKFYWTVNKFSKLKGNCCQSNNFFVGGRNWMLKLYPKGITTEHCKWLSLYLNLADTKPMKSEMIYVNADLRILDPYGCNHVTRKINLWSEKFQAGRGWLQFVCLDKLGKAYLDKEGSLEIEVVFEAVSTTKYSP